MMFYDDNNYDDSDDGDGNDDVKRWYYNDVVRQCRWMVNRNTLD